MAARLPTLASDIVAKKRLEMRLYCVEMGAGTLRNQGATVQCNDKSVGLGFESYFVGQDRMFGDETFAVSAWITHR